MKRLQRLKEQEVDMANKNGVRFKGACACALQRAYHSILTGQGEGG